MNDKDTYTKNYMSNNVVFANAFNFLIYDGEQVIKPENLQPLNTSAISIPFKDNNAQEPIQKIRDLLKKAEIKKDNNSIYLVLGIENQSDIHYAMPARNMLYDAMEYARQIKSISDNHKKNKDFKGVSSEEFLSGFYKDDKLMPVITLVIYFGANAWTAPRSIYDMMHIDDDRLIPFINNYKINLIVPNELTDFDALKLHSNLKEVLLYIKNSNNKNNLLDLVNSNKNFSKLERDAVFVINSCTNSNLKIENNQEVFDMCQAILDIKEESIKEGIERGIEKGLKEGVEKGLKEGVEKGLKEGGIISTIKMCKKFNVSFDDTISEVASEFNLTSEQAKAEVEKHW